jgi:AcrR family transcriptional regulator
MPKKPRSYRLGRRATLVAETRAKVIAAARELFLETGPQRISVDEIAARAGAGRTTVFEQFDSKAGLLRAVVEDSSTRAGLDTKLRELWEPGPDALHALRSSLELGCQVWEAERAMFRKLFGLAAVDPDMRDIIAQAEAQRGRWVGALATRLGRQGHLRPGVSVRAAADLLGVLSSFETFDALYATNPKPAKVAALLLRLASSFVARTS